MTAETAETGETVLHHEIEIARPPDAVFRFAADARTWRTWHPTTVAVRGPEGRAPVAGDTFHETIQAGPVRGTIVWRVRESEPGRRFSVEGEVDFPLMSRTPVVITYDLAPSPRRAGATLFRRELRYRPRRPLSRLADRLFFRGHNERQSRVALARLRSALEAS